MGDLMNYRAKDRILAKLDAYIEDLESKSGYADQLNRNDAYKVREKMVKLNRLQSFIIERNVFIAETTPNKYDFPMVKVKPCDYLAFLDK